MNTKLLLLGVVILGFFLRVIFFNVSPLSLYGDELTITLDAYSLLKTGHDQLGNLLPLTFQMGAGRPPGYVYLSIPFIALFGPTPLGVRGLSILSGIGIILLGYFISKKLFSKNIGLITAGLLAVSPWDISLSRGGFEAHLALFFVLLGTYLFIKASEKPSLYILSALNFGLTLHTYPTYKVTLPLFLLLLLWFCGTRVLVKGRKYFTVGVIVLFILAAAVLSQTFIGNSENRFFSINVLSQEGLRSTIEQKLNLERSITQLPQSFAKLFHNKPIEYVKVLGENYLQNFSVDFLFIHGDRNPRHNMATMGEFYFAEIVLILIGLISFWYKKRRVILFLIIWVILAPIPTAIIDLPHALRSAFMFPPLTILSSLGLATLINNRNKLLVPVSIIFLIQLVFFLQKIYFLAPIEYNHFWSYPAKVASLYAQDNRGYKYVILSDKIDNIEFAYPIYAQIDPNMIISQNKSKVILGNYQFKKFDNVYIGYIPDGEIEKFTNSLNNVLFIGSSSSKDNLKNYDTINSPDGLPTLIIKKGK